MPTILEMAEYLEHHRYFVPTLTVEAIIYYYNKLIMAQLNPSEDF